MQSVTGGSYGSSSMRTQTNALPRISPSDFPLPAVHALVAAAGSANQYSSGFSLFLSGTSEAQFMGRGRKAPFGNIPAERWALCQAMSMHRQRAGKNEEAQYYVLMAQDIANNPTSHRSQDIRGTPTAAEQTTARLCLIKILWRMRVFWGETIPSTSSLQSLFARGSLEGERGLSAINTASPNTAGFHGDGQSRRTTQHAG